MTRYTLVVSLESGAGTKQDVMEASGRDRVTKRPYVETTLPNNSIDKGMGQSDTCGRDVGQTFFTHPPPHLFCRSQ